MKIIGLSGKKQSGKSTASDFLEKMTGGTVISFADGLKNIIRVCFGATKEQLDGTDKQKNTKLQCSKTARELMQIVGTDWFRELDNHCWIRTMQRKMSLYHPELFIIPDVRFANEVKFIQEGGEGHVIRLLRAPFSDKDQHLSETALDDVHKGFFDYVLNNKGMSVEEQNMAIWELVREKGWV